MALEAWRASSLVVAVLLENLLEEGVSKGSRLWEAINTITDFKVDLAVDVDVVHELVLVDGVLGGIARFDVDVLRPVYRGL